MFYLQKDCIEIYVETKLVDAQNKQDEIKSKERKLFAASKSKKKT